MRQTFITEVMVKNYVLKYIWMIKGPRKYCGYTNHTNETSVTTPHLPLTKHSQEELVYEDKDEGGNSIFVYQEVQKSTCEVTKTSMFHIRSRTISDCSIESDDSFIIFESNEDNVDEVIGHEDLDVDEDEEDEEDEEEDESDVLAKVEFEDSSSDEECDEVDYLGRLDCPSLIDSPRITEANKKWNHNYNSDLTSPTSPKKVSFANGKNLVQIRKMVVWDFALRAARKGPWEMIALDRSRFKTKIQQLSNIISPILEQKHRRRIFHQRFTNQREECKENKESKIVLRDI
uniref:Protein phosphatase 1 regulatory subunit 15a n=1 Tax=Rhodnius prolixus TaxID=13249 RepID=A0A4P6D8M8_RHOPR